MVNGERFPYGMVDAEADYLRLSATACELLRAFRSAAALKQGALPLLSVLHLCDTHLGPADEGAEDVLAALVELDAMGVIETYPDHCAPGGRVCTCYALSNWGFFIAKAATAAGKSGV